MNPFERSLRRDRDPELPHSRHPDPRAAPASPVGPVASARSRTPGIPKARRRAGLRLHPSLPQGPLEPIHFGIEARSMLADGLQIHASCSSGVGRAQGPLPSGPNRDSAHIPCAPRARPRRHSRRPQQPVAPDPTLMPSPIPAADAAIPSDDATQRAILGEELLPGALE